MNYSIYSITCTCCHMYYIGSTKKEINERFRQHCLSNSKSKLTEHIKKTDKSNFVCKTLRKTSTRDEARTLENFYIVLYNAIEKGFNKRYESPRCKHGNIRRTCSVCKIYKCVHGKYKYNCTLCNGSSTCAHKIQKAHCKTCSGIKCSICNKVLSSKYVFKTHLKSTKHVLASIHEIN